MGNDTRMPPQDQHRNELISFPLSSLRRKMPEGRGRDWGVSVIEKRVYICSSILHSYHVSICDDIVVSLFIDDCLFD